MVTATSGPGPGPPARPFPDKWDSKDIYERFGYEYTGEELDDWAGKVGAAWPRDAELTHVLFNNCYRNYAQVNAQQLAGLLKATAPGPAS